MEKIGENYLLFNRKGLGCYRLRLITEAEFYDDIFEDFIHLNNSIQENELWKSKSLIKLLNISNEKENNNILEDGIKIILNLCNFKESGYLLDSYESESYRINELLEFEKKIVESILKNEFI